MATILVGTVLAIDTQGQNSAAELVRQLRDLPRPARPGNNPAIQAVEERRQKLYSEIGKLGDTGARALVDALRDEDVQSRRKMATALVYLSMGLYREEPRLDLTAQLPGLRAALQDPDDSVRSWVAQAIAPIGEAAQSAVPDLLTLLRNPAEGSRTSALIALRGIGPAARAALPAVRAALDDPSADVRGFAQRAIERIAPDGRSPVMR